MERPVIEVDFATLHLSNPLLLASGIADETGASMAAAVRKGAGGVVTKSLSLEPRDGHPNPCVVELPFGMLNAMGLPNPGIGSYGEEIAGFRRLTGGRTPIIGSIFGSTIDEYADAASAVAEHGVDAVEINGSCPNAKGLGLQFGQDPGVIDELVRAVVSAVEVPVFFKLTPAASNIVELALAAQDAGADGLVAINTMPAMKIDIRTGRPILSNTTGGLSGPAIRPIGVRCVHQICSSSEIEVPVIGVGGIATWEDVVEYIMAGAAAVQIGTSVSWSNLDVFSMILEGMIGFMKEEGYRSLEEIRGAALEVKE
ncbi:MAG: dihydroorotate dehydrogenase [Thermoplasmatota archaeon]